MSGHKRGQETRQRILEEACIVFGEKGFRDATHAEICRRAGSNVAAINYYFGSKEELYRAVFEHLLQRNEELYPFDEGIKPDATPEQRLRAFIRAFLRRGFDKEPLKHLHNIRMTEMFDRSGHLDEVMEKWLSRDRSYILGLLRQMMGPDVPQRDVEWCEMSIVSQCFVVSHRPRDDTRKDIFGIEEAGVERLAEHVQAFSLAGIKAIARKTMLNSQNENSVGTKRGQEKR